MQKIVNINQDITNSITSNVLNALQETNTMIMEVNYLKKFVKQMSITLHD